MNTNILDFGAVAGASVVCTTAIQSAIDTCAATGGGRVTVPAGSFVSGTIWLKSHVELHLEHGAELIASTNRSDYNAEDAYEQNYGWPPEEWMGQHFILAIEEDNVAITGSGIIDGSGDYFFEEPQESEYSYWMHGFAMAKDKEQLRPGQLVCFVECTNVTVKDVTMRNTPCWACFLHGCEVATVRGVKILNPPYFGNTDGIDIDSCSYVTVSDCIVLTGDDAIAIRCATHRLKNKERICEHITITNCILSTCACGIRMGIGTGAIQHVCISNLSVVEAGALFCMNSGFGGDGKIRLEDIHVQNVSATNVSHPFEIQDGTEAGIHYISFSDVYVEARYGSHISTPNAGTMSELIFRDVNIVVNKPRLDKDIDIIGETALVNYEGVEDLILDRFCIRVDESVRNEWENDIVFVDCNGVETNRCKYKEK